MKTTAYLSDPKLKTRFLEEITKHEEADAIVQGHYGKEEDGKWRGCAVGCSLKSMNTILGKDERTNLHARYETELGIPQTLARLEDRIFEGLNFEEAKTWPRRFAEAVPVGADLSLVWPEVVVWILERTRDLERVQKNKDVVKAMQGVIDAHRRVLGGEEVSRDEWIGLRRTAYAASADADAASAYATDAVASASAYATDAVASASAYATDAVASAYAAREKFYHDLSEKLMEVLAKQENV